ncbi:MAG TPA: hypothetical protein ENJ28_11775 [Gammaproteobacteria bacterium]|nr:hypothetical protein [Gammaproteobacteria bacterium]
MMERFIFIAILTYLTTSPLSVVASEYSWANPSEIKLKNIIKSDRIISLGFSKKGVFSYILQKNSCNKPSGSNQKISWLAIDLIQDKVVEQVDLGMESTNVLAVEILKKYGKRIARYNSKYDVITSGPYNIVTNREINLGKDVLIIQTKLVKTGIGEDAVNPGYKKYHVLLNSNKRGMKKIAQIKSMYQPLHFWGYIKSPFEERIATLFISEFRGCDAFPEMRINIVGASLKYGFPH